MLRDLKARAIGDPKNGQYPGDSTQGAQKGISVQIKVHRSEKKFVGKWIGVLKTLYAVGNERLGDAPRLAEMVAKSQSDSGMSLRAS